MYSIFKLKIGGSGEEDGVRVGEMVGVGVDGVEVGVGVLVVGVGVEVESYTVITESKLV